ncbi:MAG: methylated-DNA-protein-cysteine S-methyltransferase [Bacteroidetes bacterium]|nr:MAG: methylated-DNA-protein-cysteine S-methyltransferase [Bacteroidota bacterium]
MENDEIKYTAFVPSPVGYLKVEGDTRSVTAVVFCEEPGTQSAELPAHILETIRQLEAYFNGATGDFNLPLAQPGTDFQQKVWAELVRIPFGKTISYLELSKRIGDVKAIRAAGLANGKNNIAIIVPCHRVIGSDGSLTGYAGGLWRKEWLLRHEREIIHGKQETLF